WRQGWSLRDRWHGAAWRCTADRNSQLVPNCRSLTACNSPVPAIPSSVSIKPRARKPPLVLGQLWLAAKIARRSKIEVPTVGESDAGENNVAILVEPDAIGLVDAAKVAYHLPAHPKSLIQLAIAAVARDREIILGIVSSATGHYQFAIALHRHGISNIISAPG